MTLSVDTPAGALLKVTLPKELEFDPAAAADCSATTNFSVLALPCQVQDNSNAIINLTLESLGTPFASNGTTITVDIG